MLYFSHVMYHAVVVYGVESSPESLLLMDPNPSQGLITRPLTFFKEPHRVAKPIFIGWAVPA
jgi:hypothetical protein